MKEGKHIEYVKSLLEEMIQKSQRCPSPPRFSEQENSIQSDPDWFDVGRSDIETDDGEISTESNQQDDFTSSSQSLSIEQRDPDDSQLNSFAADEDLGVYKEGG